MMSSTGQNQSKMMMGTYGPNITGSIPLGPTIAKAISSQVHVSLANASITAEKAVGANAHAAAVRIGVVHGFLVYMALVVDSNNNFHGVLVDAGNGKVLASTQMSMMAMMQSGMGNDGSWYDGYWHGNDAAWDDERSWNDDGTPLDLLGPSATNQ